MRNLPVALVTLGDDSTFAAWTMGQCHLTPKHPLSDAATLTRTHGQQLPRGDGHKACRAEGNVLVAQHPVFRYMPYPAAPPAISSTLYKPFSISSPRPTVSSAASPASSIKATTRTRLACSPACQPARPTAWRQSRADGSIASIRTSRTGFGNKPTPCCESRHDEQPPGLTSRRFVRHC